VALAVLVTSLCLYEFAIRRFRPLRVVFGMGAAPVPNRHQTGSAATAPPG